MAFKTDQINFEAVLEYSPDMICCVDSDFHIIFYNASFTRFLEKLNCSAATSGKNFLEYLSPRQEHALLKVIDGAQGQPVRFQEELRINKENKWLDLTLQELLNRDGKAIGYSFNIIDVTARKVAESLLQDTEEKYRLLFNQTPMSLYVIDVNTGNILEVNDRAIQHYGYTREEFLLLSAADLMNPQDKNRLIDFQKELADGADPSSTGLWRQLKKDGTEFTVEVYYFRIVFEKRNAILVMAKDVSERLQLEDKLRIDNALKQQRMTEAVLAAQEKERVAIGQDLHDNVNQILGATRLYIDVARSDEEKRDELLKKSVDNLLSAMEEIRKLSKDLVGPSLGHISLGDAIRSLLDDICQAHTMSISISFDDFDDTGIAERFQMNIFRIVQEQMSNIIRHSQAENVQVLLSRSEDQIRLSILDDGKGFDPASKKRGIGLTNIVSRASLYCGKVNIISAPDEGFQLRISFPLHEACAENLIPGMK